MENLKELLKNPFDGLSNDKFNKKCAEIARELFSNYHIDCGSNKKFYFAEIEFYYYDKNVYLKDKKQYEWQIVTYPRDGYDGGDLFYHLSGIDICFKSQYNNENEDVKFGGILIRAIKDENGSVIAGPLKCKDEILNACKNGNMPKMEINKAEECKDIELKSTYRSLGKTGTDKENDRLCYYDSSIGDWNPQRDSYDTSVGEKVSKKGSYNTSKFDDKKSLEQSK